MSKTSATRATFGFSPQSMYSSAMEPSCSAMSAYERRTAGAKGLHRHGVIVGCADARSPPEQSDGKKQEEADEGDLQALILRDILTEP